MANCKNLWVWLMTPGRASWTGLPMQCRRRYHVCASISPTKLAGTSALSSAAAIKHIWLTTSQYLCRACFEFKPCYDRTQYRMQIQIKPCVEDKSNHNKCNVIINANHNMIKKTKKQSSWRFSGDFLSLEWDGVTAGKLTDGDVGEGGPVHVFEESLSERYVDSVPLGDETDAVAPGLRQLAQCLPHPRRWKTAGARLKPHL